MTEIESFEGVFQDNIQRIAFVRKMITRPSFQVGRLFLERGGLRERNIETIEKKHNELFTEKRSFKNITAHELVVAGAVNGLGSLLNIDEQRLKLLEISAYAHDATKPLDIVTKGYRTMIKEQQISHGYANDEIKRAYTILAEWLRRYGLIEKNQSPQIIIKGITETGTLEFLKFFEKYINQPFLVTVLKESQLTSEEQKKALQITTSDTWEAMPRIIASTKYYLEKYNILNNSEDFYKLVKELDSQGKIDDLKKSDVNDTLDMMLWYCDAIVGHDIPRSVDSRIKDLSLRVDYFELNEWSRKHYNGRDILQVYRTVNHTIETVFMHQLKASGKIDLSLSPTQLPQVVFNQIVATLVD